jgi:4-amino-4-deoxy-L-arabinose transferase-like glycosyltransferase
VIVLAVIACWLHWSPLHANDLVGGDEGYYGTMARNVLADGRALLGPSLHPLGPPGDKPPLYPALLAPSIAAFGPTETAARWLSVLLAAAIALGLGALVRRAAGAWAGAAAAAMLVMLPWYADASRQVAAEIPLTALGTAALVVATGGALTRRRGLSAGTLLGLAFLCKLWLIALVALPLLAACRPARGPRAPALLALTASACFVASVQLIAAALFDPRVVAHWWTVYAGLSLSGRVAGSGYAGYWLKPPGFYWGLLTHAFGLLLPLVLCGAVDAVRRFREPVPRALLLWAAGVLVLSCFAVKSGEYAYVVVPAWAALAGIGAAAFAARRLPPLWAVALGVLVTSPVVVERAGGLPLDLAPWLAGWMAFAAARVIAAVKPAVSRAAAVALTIALALPGLVREARRMPVPYHAPGYRGVAAAIAPRLAGEPAARVCFVAPEAPAFEYYLFRSGTYWSSPSEPWNAERRRRLQADTSLKVFVVDREQRYYGGTSDSAMTRWLESSTNEITAEAGARAGRPLALRVFVRR